MKAKANKNQCDTCSANIIHPEIIERVKANMPNLETLFDLAESFRIYGDTTRIGILYALLQAEMCVCDLSTLLSITQSAVSHQLRVLKQARLVRCRRDGKIAYYRLDDEHIRTILELGTTHATERTATGRVQS